MELEINYFAAAILVGILVLFVVLKRTFFSDISSPSLAFSRLSDLNAFGWRSKLAPYPKRLHFIALFFFMAAFIDPHFLLPRSMIQQTKKEEVRPLPTEGIAIYLALDRSGSMAETVQASTGRGAATSMTKIQLLKDVTKKFILEHPSDLIGIASFARVPRILVPLTLDQKVLLDQLDQIQVVKDPNDDGTAIGYAIFKTANLIAATRHFASEMREGGKPPYEIKSAVIIVVTDGFQDPSRLDYGNRLRTLELDDAANYVKSQGIRLYVINIDPALASSQFAPQRRQLEEITKLTGGKFYLTGDNQNLQSIYEEISRLEKGTIRQEAQMRGKHPRNQYTHFSFYPYLIALGLLSVLTALILETLILRRVP